MPKVKIGIKFDAANKPAIQWAKKHAAELVTEITETTRERIRDEVVGAFKEKISPAQLADLLESIVDDENRAELIAKTETMFAANMGQRQAWDQAVDKGLLDDSVRREWIVTGDKDLCDECESLDGARTDLDGEYPDPGGEGPPLHPRCRCTEGIVYG
jgi:SPP1 gp7 family putative phage head morphogenesis protein